jgi:hypothetical protein
VSSPPPLDQRPTQNSSPSVRQLIFWKNVWSFALTWSFVEQLLTYGPRNTLGVVTAALAFACVATLPMHILGKR